MSLSHFVDLWQIKCGIIWRALNTTGLCCLINDNHQAENEKYWGGESINTVKRTLELCTNLSVCVNLCRLYLHIIVCGHISDI